jgi:hypothetical protein
MPKTGFVRAFKDAAKVLDDLCEVLDWFLLRYAKQASPNDASKDGKQVGSEVPHLLSLLVLLNETN